MKPRKEIMETLIEIVKEIENDPAIRKKEEKLVKKLQQPCSPFPWDIIQ